VSRQILVKNFSVSNFMNVFSGSQVAVREQAVKWGCELIHLRPALRTLQDVYISEVTLRNATFQFTCFIFFSEVCREVYRRT
jgi:hypothetical protein